MADAGVRLGVALLAGLASFASPCVLPLVPAYLGMLTGVSLESYQGRRFEAVLRSLLFVLGFSLVFIAWGAAASVLGRLVSGQMLLLQRLGGIVLVLLGLHLTGLLKLPFLYRERSLRRLAPGASYLASFLTGVFFFAGWVPCVGPVLTAILLLAGKSETVYQGAGLLALYCIGLGLPFVVIALFADALIPRLRRLSRLTRWVEIASGVLVIAIGLAIFFDRYSFILRVFS
ncbi:MAG: cytochrome c biogenesis CcdA family protein [Anaerolineae bacterium]